MSKILRVRLVLGNTYTLNMGGVDKGKKFEKDKWAEVSQKEWDHLKEHATERIVETMGKQKSNRWVNKFEFDDGTNSEEEEDAGEADSKSNDPENGDSEVNGQGAASPRTRTRS